MKHIQFTLLADGPTDRALLPILDWIIRETLKPDTIGHEFLPTSELREQYTLAERLQTVVAIYPCNILFVHRDAENQDPELRYDEIARNIAKAAAHGFDVPHLSVVPIRMTEAWLLLDQLAIRRAAGNPNGTQVLNIPKVRQLESIPDPKARLHEALRDASGKHGRRRTSFDVQEAAALVPEFISSFAPLRQLRAFARLEADLLTLSLSLLSPE